MAQLGKSFPYREVLKAVSTVCLWYLCNITVSLSNRYLLTTGLRAPVSLTCLHMVCTFCFATFGVHFLGFEKQHIQSRDQLWKVITQSLTFGTSIVCGVSALGHIPVSFNEMISSTTPLFTAIIAYALQRESQTYEKVTALLLVAVGASISSGGEPSWNMIGFLLAVTATATRGLKAVLQAVLLTNTEEKLSSMNLLRYMTGIVIVILVPTVIATEGATRMTDVFIENYHAGNVKFLIIMSLNVSAAFMSNLSQFLVTKCVGAVVLQVLGNFKGVVNACLSVMVFQNAVTTQSIGGYSLTTCGVFWYTYLKQTQKKEKQYFQLSTNEKQPLVGKVGV